MFEAAVHWITETVFRLGYPGIVILMALESSLVPFPSEVVLPPAGYLAAQGRMSAPLATLAGLTGSLIGALFNYVLAARLGRPFLRRYHRYLLMKEASLDRAEAFFRQHGEISTFVARLIPVIRQLISLPAGLARMRLDRFLLYTAAGAGIWCVILTGIGWYVGRHPDAITSLDEQVHRYSRIILLVLLPLLAVIVTIYIVRYRRRRVSGAGDREPLR